MPTTGLKRITVPQLDSAMFGQNIRDQFINIDLNFQKLANQELQKGADGTSATYLVYNLDCIFAEATGWDAEYKLSGLDGNNFMKSYCEGCSLSSTQKAAIEEDYARYLDITGRSKADYAVECWRILFGTDPETGLNTNVEEGSLVYVLAERAYLQGTQQKALYKDHESVWLYKWIKASNSEDAKKICQIHLQEYGPYRIAMAALTEYDPPKYAGSLAYVFLDPRYYMSGLNEIDEDMMGNYEVSEDMSCVVYALPQVADDKFVRFTAVRTFPQLYAQNGSWYWSLNGQQSGIPAAGPAGKDGGNGLFLIVQRIENGMRLQYAAGKAPKNDEYGYKFFEIHPQTAYWRSKTVGTLDPDWTTTTFPWNQTQGDDPTFYRNYVGAHAVSEQDFAWMSHIPSDTMSGNYRFRVRKIVGTDTQFFEANAPVNYIGGEFENDLTPSDHELDGMYTGWKPIEDQNIQDQIAELEGVPCIILPGPEYMRDHHQTTYWFSTIKVISSSQGSSKLEPTVYCGPENMITIYLDETTQAGMMFGLDVYEHLDSNNIGTGQHKPRGMMLPIGARFIWNNGFMEGQELMTNKDEFAAHIIYSDLGAWDHMEPQDRGNQYRNGIPRNPKGSLKLGETRMDNGTDMQGKAVSDKRVLHIGSVQDYRALDYVTSDNPGTPGRLMKQNAGDTYEDHAADHFAASELHIDEPTVITRYRDTYPETEMQNATEPEKSLMPSYSGNWLMLRVEGDVLIGPGNHVNEGYGVANEGNAERIGGMIIHGRVDPKTFGLFTALQHQAVIAKTNSMIQPEYIGNPDREVGHELSTPFITATCKTGFNCNKVGQVYTILNSYYYGLFVENALGAQVVHASEGLLVYRFNENNVNIAQRPVFAVDREGNMLLNGNEVRSTSKNTEWMFHTVWQNPVDDDQQWVANPVAFTTDHETQYQGVAWPKQSATAEFAGYEAPTTTIRTALGYQNIGNGGTKHYTLRYHTGHATAEFVFPPVPALLDMYAALTIMHGGLFVEDYSPFASHHDENRGWRYSGTFLRGLYVDGIAQTIPDSNATFDGKNKKIEDTTWNRINALTMPEGGNDSLGILDGGMSNSQLSDNYRWNYLGFYDSYDYTKSNSPYAKNLKAKTPITVHEAIMTKNGAADGDANNRTDIGFFVNTGSEFAGKVIMDSQLGVKGDIRSAANIISDGHLISRSNAFVMGQLEADQFRRHTTGNTVGSVLLGNGWSTWPSPMWKSIKSPNSTDFYSKKNDQEDAQLTWSDPTNQFSGIVLDIGKFYGKNRFIHFGVCKSIEEDTSDPDKPIHFYADQEDGKMMLFGKWPEYNMGYFRMANKSASGIFGTTQKINGVETPVNKFRVTAGAMSSLAVIQVEIDLDARFTSRGHYNGGAFGWGHARRSNAWGFCMQSGDQNQNDYYDAAQPEFKCAGWDWGSIFEELGGDFPKPGANVDCWVGSTYHGRTGHGWEEDGGGGHFQMGVLFRLNSSGELWVPIHYGPGAILPDAAGSGKTYTLTFAYPIQQETQYTIYQFNYNNSDNTPPSGGVSFTLPSTGNANDWTERLSDITLWCDNNNYPRSTVRYVWVREGTVKDINNVQIGSNVTWGDWYILLTYVNVQTKFWISTEFTENADTGEQNPSGTTKEITPEDGSDLEVLLAESGKSDKDFYTPYLSQIPGAKYVWRETITDGESSYEMIYTDSSSSAGGNAKEIKILLSGTLYRNSGSSVYDDASWKKDRMWGPAANSFKVGFWVNGKVEEMTGRMVLGITDKKYVPTSAHVQQAWSDKVDDTTGRLGNSNTRSDGAHWFSVHCRQDANILSDGSFHNVIIHEFHSQDQNNDTWHTSNYGHLYGLDITVFGYEE